MTRNANSPATKRPATAGWLRDEATKESAFVPASARTEVRGSLRRASVLVLVMTLLGVLFVIGVAFLATMNFEAEMIAAQSYQDDRSTAIDAASDQVKMLLQNVFASTASSDAPYAEMPKVHPNFSPIEPSYMTVLPGPDGISATADDVRIVAYPWVTDAVAASNPAGATASTAVSRNFFVDPSVPVGWQMVFYGKRCLDGPAKGQPCTAPAQCPGSDCKAPVVVDADGDGINDSVQVLASDLGLSEQQVSAIAAQVNPPSNPGGRVFAGLRVVPHGGMVDLNHAHPNMIANVFADLMGAGATLSHSPLDRLVFYSPLVEEAGLRNRGILPARVTSPSLLQGDPFASQSIDTLNADLASFLMWPRSDGMGIQSVRAGDHRYAPFTPCDDSTTDCLTAGEDSWWQYRMEPFKSAANFTGSLNQYDRRHLVTTVSHDDLLARPVTVPTGGSQRADLLGKMREANRAAWDPDVCAPAFEYADYPHDMTNKSDPTSGRPTCDCPTEGWCDFDERKGRLKLSLAWLQRMLDASSLTLDPSSNPNLADAGRLIHDVFAAMLQNLVDNEPAFCDASNPCPAGLTCDAVIGRCSCTATTGCPVGSYCLGHANPLISGRCTAVASYWDDQECMIAADCASGELCNTNLGAFTGDTYGLCVDGWTGLPRSQARLSRTAASLTANLIDFVDADNVPTRVALRNFDPTRGFCPGTAPTGLIGAACVTNSDCGGTACGEPKLAFGRDFDSDPSSTALGRRYVYGIEQQPFMTEVGVQIERIVGTDSVDKVGARAVELFNPYALAINLSAPNVQYLLIEVDPAGVLPNNEVILSGQLNPGTFSIFVSEDSAGAKAKLLGTSPQGTELGGSGALTFGEGWIVYLVRRFAYPGDGTTKTDVVLDQFTVAVAAGHIPKPGDSMPLPDCENRDPEPNCRYSVERAVMAGSPWTAPVPYAPTDRFDIATFGTWNGPDDAVTQTIHPVEVQVSDVGVLARTGPFDTRPEAFPTPGSLLLPLRVANRSMADYVPPLTPAGTTFPTLAFTTELHGSDAYTVLGFDATGVALPAPMQLQRKDQIDNGRAPIFDVGFNPGGAAGDFAAHHIPPQVESPQPAGFDVNNPSTWPGPGGLRTNPWGQLIFDYFTTLPLSSPGPYVCPSGDPSCPPIVDAADAASLARLAGAKPRVDQDGLRVQGRVNLNSAPWKALAGVPFVPMDRIPVAFRATVKGALNLTDALGGPLADNAAGALGDRRAQAIVAYREAGDIGYFDPVSGTWVTTGDYGDSPVPGNPNIYRGRGWKNAAPQTRRGTGFMSVGELANVRNALASGWQFWMIGQPATAVSPPLIDTLPEAPDNNSENFIAAAAPLIALNEWVSVRSHVFTVYGVFRGEANPDLDQSTMSPADVQKDINSRAIRFQETIDRLPTFLGQPLPQRIGDRAAGPYMDYRN